MITKIQVRKNEYKSGGSTTKLRQIELWIGGMEFKRDVNSETDIKMAERLTSDAGLTLYRIDLE